MLLLRQLCASAATAVASCGGGVSWRAAAAAAAAAAQTLAAAAAASPAPASPPATQRRALHLAPPFLVEDYVPVSVMTHRLGRARQKAARALEQLKACRACPRDCGVDRAAGAVGVCGVGRHAVVATVAPHYGEEACLQGWRGSGTIFFSGCSMRCVFCQNWDISWPRGGGGGGGDKSNGSSSGGGSSSSGGSSSGSTPAVKGFELTADALAGWMLKLQDEGRVHNINLVTPEHVVPQVVEALALALDKGLSLPIVYNTSGYDSLESLRLLEGLVDIYMPDFKFWTAGSGERYARCRDYPDAARAAIKEMHRQVGDLVFEADGLAKRGLLLRHLVMPGLLDEGKRILEWAAAELSRDTFVNVMPQYFPAGPLVARGGERRARLGDVSYAELQAPPPRGDAEALLAHARSVGLWRFEEAPRYEGLGEGAAAGDDAELRA